MDAQAVSMMAVRIMDGAKQVSSLLTVLDEPDVTRLAISDPKNGSALQPESGEFQAVPKVHCSTAR